MSEPLNPAEFNAVFSAAIDGGSVAVEKLAEATGLYVQDKLREGSLARKILPPQTVTERELTRSVDDEGLSYIDDIEPDSVAMTINMRGEPNRTYVQGKRYAIKMHTVASERFQKSIQELRSYRMPLTKVIEQNTVKDIQEVVDTTFMTHVKSAIFLATLQRHNALIDRGVLTVGTAGSADGDAVVTAAGGTTRNFANEAEFLSYLYRHDKFGASRNNGGAVFDISDFGTVARPANQHSYSNLILSDQTEFNRYVLRDLFKVQPARQMKARCFLLHETDFTDLLAWDNTDAGLEITSEIVKDGYKYSTIGGYTFITTVRDNPDIVQPGQIFGFPSPEFLGRFLTLENTKFFIKTEGRFVSMEAWEEVGMGFGNIRGISCILLAGASITLPATWLKASGAASGVGANANEDGYDSGNDGASVTVLNSTTLADIATAAGLSTEA